MTSSVPHEEGTRDPLVDYCDRLINDEAWACSAEEMADHIRDVLGYGTGEQFAAAVSRLTTERDEAQAELERLAPILSVLEPGLPYTVNGVATDPDTGWVDIRLEQIARPPSEGKEST